MNKTYNNHFYDGDEYTYMTPMGGVFSGVPIATGKTEETRKKDAALMSTIGSFASYIPIVGKPLGLALSLPDMMYDLKDAMKNPKSWKAWAHIILDGINRGSRFTRTPIDDYIGYAGTVDDAVQSTRNDVFEWAQKALSPNPVKPVKKTNSKTENKKSSKTQKEDIKLNTTQPLINKASTNRSKYGLTEVPKW